MIRLSGEQAIAIVEKIFHSADGESLHKAKAYTLHYGTINDAQGESIDDVLVGIFHAPRSYTGENVVEISCHGSRYIIGLIFRLLIQNGCRQALPGEFTQRAYLNGKMDLSQAEAVADLIASTNRTTHQLAISQLRGNFSSELSYLREQLLKMTSLMELELDFGDHEDLKFADRSDLLDLARNIHDQLTTLSNSFVAGKAIKEGIAVTIVGKTNVGKSTLLNRLLHEDRAIVSDIHGTTRDSIEDTTQLNGVTFRFIDTAGLRQTTDTIEQVGINRTWEKLSQATIVLWIVDEEPTVDDIADMRKKCEKKKLIVVRNKIDREQVGKDDEKEREDNISSPKIQTSNHEFQLIPISAKFGTNIEKLEAALYEAIDIPEIKENDVIITNVRHYEALQRADKSICRVIEGLTTNLSGDLLSEDLRDTLHILAEITGGEITPEETLSNIFKNFCIGK